MANETLNQVAMAAQAADPSRRVRSIGWGPWDGGMVTGPLAAHFTRLGVPLIPLDAGARAFVAEADAADYAVHVLIGAGDDPSLATARPRVAVEAALDAHTHGYLADHAPADVPVLPLALAVEWFAAAGRSSHPDRPTALRDIRVLSRVDLPLLESGGHRFTVDATVSTSDPDALDLKLTGSSDVAHYRASLVPLSETSDSWTLPQRASGEVALGDEVYEASVLFHGPGFQVLRRLDALSDDGAEAQIAGVREIGWPGGPWWTDPAAIDGALQTAVLWAGHATGHAMLPMGVDALRVHRAGPAPGVLRCLVRAVAASADQARCDIALLDQDGGLRAELLGVSLIRRPDLPSVLGGRTSVADVSGPR
jgi:hypothetical protein